MLADQVSRMTRYGRPLAACAVLAALAVPAAAGRASASSAPGRQQVSYLGRTFKIPGSWPVISDADHPHGCVRFDRHAIYLGAPGVNQDCPSKLFGTTEAMLIQPGPARAALTSTENPVARQITVTAPGLSITATFDTDPAAIYRILASAALPAPVIMGPNRAGRSAGGARRRVPTVPGAVTNFRGRGFDACAAPSRAFMRAWRRHSRYRAIGIYIGGADRACDQRNLTPGWIRHEASAGWHFIPLYVGPQAAFREIHAPARQGRRAAADAVWQAERLGFAPRTPLYYDMEAFRRRQAGAALHFLSAWTAALRRLGYLSGVYSSSRSGIRDLARQYSRHLYTMPNVIYDALWNGSPNTTDKVYHSGEWGNHQRIHQYRGNVTQTHGHDTINIDQDFLNVNLPEPFRSTSQATGAVSRQGGVVDVFFRGADRRLWRIAHSARSGWARPVDMGGMVGSVPSAVSIGSRTLYAFYKGAHSGLWDVSFRPGKGWARARRISGMGKLSSAPRAVAQPDGVVNVFWRGAARHLWVSQFRPGHGWTGPRNLGGRLASYPFPVESSPSTAEVFWEGTGRSLWRVTRNAAGHWSRPVRMGMGPLGGPPRATAQASGRIEVFWEGSGKRHHIWAAFRGPHGWHGPYDLGGRVVGAPWPATAAGAVRVLWRGRDGRLWEERRLPKGRWTSPVRLPVTGLRSRPFAAAGSWNSPLEVFWRGRAGRLWWASLTGGRWTAPRRIGGRLG
jgi:hypothetical protein